MDFKDGLIAAYDADAQRRVSNEDIRDAWKIDSRNRFGELVVENGGKTLIELGAGVGLDSAYFQNDLGLQVTATDLSPKMVDECLKRGLVAKVVDLYELTKFTERVDAIYSMNVLLHVPREDLEGVLSEIFKSLNENGLFFYGVYGGKDEEKTITDPTKMNMPRYFSFLSDNSILEAVSNFFEVIEFKKVPMGSKDPNFYFQSLILKKK